MSLLGPFFRPARKRASTFGADALGAARRQRHDRGAVLASAGLVPAAGRARDRRRDAVDGERRGTTVSNILFDLYALRLDLPSNLLAQCALGALKCRMVLSALLDGEISILVAFATKIVKQHP